METTSKSAVTQGRATRKSAGQRTSPPKLGESVDEVIRAFMRLSDEWMGMAVHEILLPVTLAGPARRYRLMSKCSAGKGSRMGVSLMEGFSIRAATPAEEDELEEALSMGFGQVERVPGRWFPGAVLHQATGRSIPMRLD